MCYSIPDMKIVALAILFALFQAAPPIPREATKHASQEGHDVKDKSATKKAPATQPQPSQNPSEAQTPEKDGSEAADHNEEESKPVRVAPVNVHKDWADYLYIAASLALTIATLIIAGIALMQARAARAGVDALMESERAWLTICPDAFNLQPSNRFDWIITNTGRTTARIVEASIRCKKYTVNEHLPDTPVFRDPIVFPNVPLAPGGSLKIWSYIEAQERDYNGLTAKDIDDIRTKGDELVAYGIVRYFTFGREHRSRFCYYYAVPFNEFRINLSAPAAYHECD